MKSELGTEAQKQALENAEKDKQLQIQSRTTVASVDLQQKLLEEKDKAQNEYLTNLVQIQAQPLFLFPHFTNRIDRKIDPPLPYCRFNDDTD